MKKLLVLLSLLTGLAQAGDVVFHSIPVVPQSTISAVKKEMPVVLDGETVLAPMTINETNRCGYHALFNAARFISRFADAGSTSATHDLESKI
ncbi:hypothetical protein FJ364_06135, partial [Candidatus Dependentiae bacterium]|nr:hypothetical protein [Candidatus Dependentiae bacterium]